MISLFAASSHDLFLWNIIYVCIALSVPKINITFVCRYILTECKCEQLEELSVQGRLKANIIEENVAQIRELESKAAEASVELERWQEKIYIADREMVFMESEMKESEVKGRQLERDIQELKNRCKNLQDDLDEERRRADQDADNASIREHEVSVCTLACGIKVAEVLRIES